MEDYFTKKKIEEAIINERMNIFNKLYSKEAGRYLSYEEISYVLDNINKEKVFPKFLNDELPDSLLKNRIDRMKYKLSTINETLNSIIKKNTGDLNKIKEDILFLMDKTIMQTDSTVIDLYQLFLEVNINDKS